jgi:hypothetical protein
MVVFTPEMRARAGGLSGTEIEATTYRGAMRALCNQFPKFSEAMFAKCSVAIDGVLVHSPLLETFEADSELVFIPKITGG